MTVVQLCLTAIVVGAVLACVRFLVRLTLDLFASFIEPE